MKRCLIIGVAAIVFLTGCGEDREPVSDEEGGTTDQEAEVGRTYDSAEAAHLYEQNCLSCHGQMEDNESGATGPPLVGYSAEEVLDAIVQGPGSMPAGLLEGEEAEAVANYIADYD
ncbi:cytochrome c [Geomicrobium sp. JCM 19038]|uniref:c-type cytochrome n=1 Tax=Geomicrobium sp. JCM 19038 TaxID=1460635 RepID=UPI00045F4599|nr:cytochrome c [Geomicrobium sp. JCM 19038]GAK07237.1 cytochrome c551 [Geomicrobium sp. JCM 19038]